MEFITTYTRTNKNGNTYYYQEFKKMDVDNDGNWMEEITWTGIARKEDYDWCMMIATEQPDRLIMNDGNILVIKN